jgi:hypothetical protein
MNMFIVVDILLLLNIIGMGNYIAQGVVHCLITGILVSLICIILWHFIT